MKLYFLNPKTTFPCLLIIAASIGCTHRGETIDRNVPKDEELLSIFRAHQKAFEQVLTMSTEDAQKGLYLNAPSFEQSKLPETRRQAYLALLSEIRPGIIVAMDGRGVQNIQGEGSAAPRSVARFEPMTLRFLFAGGGEAIGASWGKGIEYVAEDVQRQGVILTNLDEALPLPENVYLRQIETNWFLFYQRND